MGIRAWTRAATLVVLLAACAATPAWQRVPLPDGFAPVSLAATSDGVLVGGKAGTGPALLRVSATAVGEAFDLRPAEPAAEEAALISVSSSGDDVYAIGRMFAGAHSNPRLTVWDGTDSAGTLVSRPQEFFTFGGHDAGPTLGTLVIAGEPIIVGSRTNAAGGEAVLWTRTGTTWQKHTGLAPAVQSDAHRVLGFTTAAQSGTRLLIGGDEVTLADGIRQRPAIWVGSLAGDWRQLSPALPADRDGGGGQLARVTSLACSRAGACWAAGWAGGRPLAWPVDAADASVGDPVRLGGTAPETGDPEALVALAGDVPAVLTNATVPTLELGCPAGWRTLPAPDEPASALAATPAGAYVVTASGLWWQETPTC